jgi:hypothetical protein
MGCKLSHEHATMKAINQIKSHEINKESTHPTFPVVGFLLATEPKLMIQVPGLNFIIQ